MNLNKRALLVVPVDSFEEELSSKTKEGLEKLPNFQKDLDDYFNVHITSVEWDGSRRLVIFHLVSEAFPETETGLPSLQDKPPSESENDQVAQDEPQDG